MRRFVFNYHRRASTISVLKVVGLGARGSSYLLKMWLVVLGISKCNCVISKEHSWANLIPRDLAETRALALECSPRLWTTFPLDAPNHSNFCRVAALRRGE